MPKLTLPILNEYPAITRRVAMHLLKTILEHLGIQEDIYISFKGENNPNVLWDTETRVFRQIKEVIDGDRFSHGDKVEIEIREEYSDRGYNRNILNDTQYPPIWHEPKLNISLRPNYIGKQLELSMTYKFKTPEGTSEFLSQLTTLLAINRTSLPVNLPYYIIPDQRFLTILGHLHHLQEQNAGYGIDFNQWIENHADMNSFRNLSKLNGVNSAYGFKEVQAEIYAELEIQSLPDKSKREGNPGHEVTLVAKLHYEKPYSVTMSYPVTVHNQMIDKRLIIRPEVLSSQKKDYRMDLAGEKLANIRNIYIDGKFGYSSDNGLSVPLGDDWMEPTKITPYSVIFTGLVPITKEPDEEGSRCIGRLDAYGRYLQLSEGFREYARDCRDQLLQPKLTPMLVRVWKNNKQVDPMRVWIDEKLSIYTNIKLSQRDVLHLTISVCRDLSVIRPLFFRDLIEYPIFAEELTHQYSQLRLLKPVSNYLLELKQRWYSQPAYLQREEPIEEYIARVAEKEYFGNLPLDKKGIWHRILLYLLFKSKLPEQYMKYVQFLVTMAREQIEDAKNVDELHRTLNNQRYLVYQQFKEDHPDWDDVKIRQEFFGYYNVKKLKYQLITMYPIVPGDMDWAKGWGIPYQSQFYLTVRRPKE